MYTRQGGKCLSRVAWALCSLMCSDTTWSPDLFVFPT